MREKNEQCFPSEPYIWVRKDKSTIHTSIKTRGKEIRIRNNHLELYHKSKTAYLAETNVRF